jgi:hypothetical protein
LDLASLAALASLGNPGGQLHDVAMAGLVDSVCASWWDEVLGEMD